MRRALLLIYLMAVSAPYGREWRIAPDPSGRPVIGDTLSQAQPGDVLRLAAGIYRETITIRRAVAVVGEPGAVLDPSAPLRVEWQPAPDIGPGVFRARVKEKPATLFLDGRVLAEIDERRTRTEGDWYWKTLLARGTPLGGFQFIRAAWIYRAEEKAVYLHLEHDADPASLAMAALWERGAAVAITGAEGASVRGIEIRHAYTGITLSAARACSVTECRLGPWDRNGIELRAGAATCTIERNEIFRGAFEDWVPVDDSKLRYEIWQIHKKAGFYDRVGISLVRAGSGNRVRGNHVFETFDGINVGDSDIESLDLPLTRPDDGRDTEIADNIIERTRDSGIELGAGCINVRVHHNVLRKTHGGLRFKLPRIGPVFIYRNVLVDGTPFNIWYSMDDSPAEGYVYHNTIIGGSAALVYSSFVKPHGIGAPRWHYLNNLVIGRQGFFRNWRVQTPVNFTADYNVIVGGNRPWPNDATRDQHSRYVEAVSVAGFPPAPTGDSAAIDAGLDLSTYFHGGPLPGCEPGYFKGKAPDAGALEVR